MRAFLGRFVLTGLLIGIACSAAFVLADPASAKPKTPVVTSVQQIGNSSPNGTRLAIQGFHLRHVEIVLVGTTPASAISGSTGRLLEVTAPATVRGLVAVRVKTPRGTSAPTAKDEITLGTLPTLDNLHARAAGNTITLKWAVLATQSGASRIVIRRGTSTYPRTTTQGTSVANTSATSTTAVDKRVNPLVRYRYSAFVSYIGGRTSGVAHISAVRAGPALKQFQAKAAGTAIKLTWKAVPSSTGATRIVIRRGTKTYPRTVKDGTGIPASVKGRTVTDKTVKASTRYRYSAFVIYPGKRASLAAHVTTTANPTNYTKKLWLALLFVALLFGLVASIRRVFPPAPAVGPGGEAAVPPLAPAAPGAVAVAPVAPAAPVAAPPDKKGLAVGVDGRASTSKAAVLLWTAVLLYFLMAMLLIFGTSAKKYDAVVDSTSLLYIGLLGGPIAAAGAAKSIVGTAVGRNPSLKKPVGDAKISDLFSDDDGNADLVDTQYLLFNLIVAGTLVAQFVHSPASGAPHIPTFLLLLTGTSAAGYVGNKHVQMTPPMKAR